MTGQLPLILDEGLAGHSPYKTQWNSVGDSVSRACKEPMF